MEIGVGLPMKALSRQDLTSFVQKVEGGPFNGVSLGQRLTFESNDPLIALTFVAAVTTRIRLLTSVLCLPYHKVGVTAQQAATLDRLSEGRFSFGLGLGGRESDFAVAPEAWPHRGQRFEEQLVALRRIFRGEPPFEGTEPVGPTPHTSGGPELIVGAFAPAGLERAGRLADGIRSFSFSTDPEEHLGRYQIMLRAWEEAGRKGTPRLIAATHFSLGPNARQSYEAHVAKYYGYSRATVDEALSGSTPTSPEAIRSTIARFAEVRRRRAGLHRYHDGSHGVPRPAGRRHLTAGPSPDYSFLPIPSIRRRNEPARPGLPLRLWSELWPKRPDSAPPPPPNPASGRLFGSSYFGTLASRCLGLRGLSPEEPMTPSCPTGGHRRRRRTPGIRTSRVSTA